MLFIQAIKIDSNFVCTDNKTKRGGVVLVKVEGWFIEGSRGREEKTSEYLSIWKKYKIVID